MNWDEIPNILILYLSDDINQPLKLLLATGHPEEVYL